MIGPTFDELATWADQYILPLAKSRAAPRGPARLLKIVSWPLPSRLARRMSPALALSLLKSAQYIFPAATSRLGPSGSFSFVTSVARPVPSRFARRMSPVPVVFPRSAQYMEPARADCIAMEATIAAQQ